MSHVKKAQAYAHWPTGCPKRARMKDPSLHEPSKKVLQMKTWPGWKPTEGPKHNKPTQHQSKPKPMQEGPHCHGSPFLTPQYSL